MTASNTTATVILLLLILLLLVYIFEFDFATITSNVPIVLRRCDCKPVISNKVVCPPAQPLKKSDLNKTTYSIPQQDWYDKMIAAGIGKRGGPKNNISLVAAYEYPEQVNVMMTSRDKYGDVVYCRYIDKSGSELGDPFKSVVFPEYNVHCLRREDAAFMSLSDSPTAEYEFPVPIIDRTQSEQKHFFSVCVAPIYGNESKWLLLTELIEHYKLQGATYFYVYSKYIDEYSRILLDDYVRTGEAETIVLHDRFERKDDRWQSVQLQDCLLRARRHSRWIAFIDLDERLTLTDVDGTIHDYLRNISESSPQFGSIQFRQRWILKNESAPNLYVGDDQVSLWMPTRRYHNTSHVGPPGHTTKCIVDPKKVLIMNVHTVAKFFDGYQQYAMKPEEGVVRHYRDVVAGDWGKWWLKSVEAMGNFSMTDYPEQLASKLMENVQKRLQYVYGTQ
ncbi:hypothetical protein Aduo_011037 [Ancylostoma duodenale]